jgi:hypothetical protein
MKLTLSKKKQAGNSGLFFLITIKDLNDLNLWILYSAHPFVSG